MTEALHLIGPQSDPSLATLLFARLEKLGKRPPASQRSDYVFGCLVTQLCDVPLPVHEAAIQFGVSLCCVPRKAKPFEELNALIINTAQHECFARLVPQPKTATLNYWYLDYLLAERRRQQLQTFNIVDVCRVAMEVVVGVGRDEHTSHKSRFPPPTGGPGRGFSFFM